MYRTASLVLHAVSLVFLQLACAAAETQDQDTAQATAKPRIIVTSDGEVDDVDSFIRLLLYANEFDIEGLVYSSSQWHYAGDGKGTLFTSEMPFTARRYGERTELRWSGTQWMQEHIGRYAEVYDNLLVHEPGYPSPDSLLSLIRVGNIEFEGEMEKDTEGSELIKQILLDENPAPVYLQAWGGTNTVARALKSIEDVYGGTPQWRDIYEAVSAKAVIYTILDQDGTYRNYIEPNWPDIKVLYNSAQFWSFAYAWPRVVPAELQPYLGGSWFSENIKFNHGPLLEGYYLWGDGQQIPNDPEHTHGSLERTIENGRAQYDFISEGDSPAYFHLLDVGLRNAEDPSYGGWGGRLVRSEANPSRWEDGDHVTDHNPYTDEADTAYPQTRWVSVLQNDFAARADWNVMSYDEANHPPAVTLDHASDLTAAPGAYVQLSGAATDPDGDAITYRWWQYGDVDSYEGDVVIKDADRAQASFTVPEDTTPGETIHVILEATDAGAPPLTRYRRVVVTVEG
ncbi:MAG: DUF1593 domain-containing protein [Gemmatimonadota bacterium]|nr:MAG: DUF1593 domain-containing protein [Gemmatimonadota bacterium]